MDHNPTNTIPRDNTSLKTLLTGQKAKPHAYLPLIKTLPVFADLSEQALNDLLPFARVQTLTKGIHVFEQGEKIDFYRVIVQGWVKLFIGRDSGEETVVQVLSKGDSIMDAAIFLDIPSTVGAQIVQDTIVFSIPADKIRNVIANNSTLANAALNSIARYSQSLIQQMEHSRLMSAKERVGWFLLKTGLEQNKGKTTTITLPFDKTVIASYLDMTPETFSRTLKKFRDKGFVIENTTITKPDSKALCLYCDQGLAEVCAFKNDPDCPQKEDRQAKGSV